MKLKLSDWASIADVVAGISVVITLVFLITSIRENTAATRADSYETLVSDINEFTLTISEDAELSRIWALWTQSGVSDLSDEELFRVILLLRTLVRNYEKAYFAHEYGTLGSTEYGRFEEGHCRNWGRAEDTGIWSDIALVLAAEYAQYVEDSCRAEN